MVPAAERGPAIAAPGERHPPPGLASADDSGSPACRACSTVLGVEGLRLAPVGDVLSFLLRQIPETAPGVKAGAWFGLGVAVAQVVVAFAGSPEMAEMV